MSIQLTDSRNRSFRVNGWNWGVLHHVVALAGVLPDEVWAPKRSNCSGSLEADQVATLAAFLEHDLLPRLEVGQRMFFDGTVTDEPDDGTFFREESELWKNYSLRRDVLSKLISFLHVATGEVQFI